MRRLALPVLLSGTFVQLMSVTVMQIVVPDVRADLAAGAGAGQLVVAGYTLTFACTLITAARLGDRWGHRRLFVVGTAIFTAAAATGALAPDADVLVVARLVQGIGSGLVAPQVLSIIQRSVDPGRRARALSWFGATMAVASLAGPVLGGVLLELDPLGAGWRAALAVTVPVGVAALVLWPVLPRTGGGVADRVPLDVAGALLSVTGLSAVVLPLALGGEQGWPMWTRVSFAAAVVLLSALVVQQRRAAYPLVQPAALGTATARLGIGVVLVFNAGVPSFVLLLSLHLQGPVGFGPLRTAGTIATYAVGALAGSALAEPLARRRDVSMLAGASLVLAAVCGATVVVVDHPGPALWTVLALGGIAFGAFTASAFTLVLAEVPAGAVGTVSGLLPTAQQLGGTIGVALCGAAYTAGAVPSFGRAGAYQVTVFLLAAAVAVALTRATRSRTAPELEARHG
ncbi:Transmembrane efflux protein [Pseudonocardia sp. Ae406_Ps2]|uniref:MFS transporter n=1 Tax=unclassified Pseudonocardia TaxID=2619320 RepID=UPI00094B066D|nr:MULTISPECIES: MFS transporter [unclassified Pseudonocardia]OLM01583.1 Transmembrane efflux protein [Pseudonocardia sp. Ae406_Ps2]OLM06614.1 Transmembrane efflux protein [Pseudonocardia sp. Ae331_Ps2]OLM13368.1 Transmembrane efflux protein [Pseudonocardia sp. Ae505_Ps2]OLM23155.1 Transmembrane efflux protein [Pseudonocardia sp. Ae706_Ps2]OLM32228.1 Transmembrane efflux protein [Pseudonocardia sp. Ae717_Ps2]